jgi:uncharacterized protein
MNTEEVRFDAGGCPLAGTFVEADHAVAAALLLPGSGKSDRDSNARLPFGQVLRIGVSKAIADALEPAGVSSLRYDKRGVGASGGADNGVGMPQRLSDAHAALRWLAGRAAGLPLLVFGLSEGTYYAAQLAAADTRVSGIVLIGGSVRRGDEVLAYQTAAVADRLPASARLILRLMRTDAIRAQRKNMDKILASTADVIRVQGNKVNARWFRDFCAYEPGEALAEVTVPVLAITGEHDLQVPPADVDAIGRLVRGPFEGHVVHDLSHLLRPDPASVGPRGYRRAVRQPVSPEVLTLITNWVARNWGGPAASEARSTQAATEHEPR